MKSVTKRIEELEYYVGKNGGPIDYSSLPDEALADLIFEQNPGMFDSPAAVIAYYEAMSDDELRAILAESKEGERGTARTAV